MFYIVETEKQVDDLIKLDYSKVFIEPILRSDKEHPYINEISLLYIHPLDGDKGFMVSYNHSETMKLNKSVITNLLNSFKEIYVRDRKTLLYYFPLKNIIDISLYCPEYKEPSTSAHDYFYNKFYNVKNINFIIPLTKHYEKCEVIFNLMRKFFISDNIAFNNKLTSVFFAIERNGIKINKELFDKFFNLEEDECSIEDDFIYTQYNLYTTTGRPSNSFNGINFAALNKENGCRTAFIPNNDKLIEIDIRAYHPTLAAKLVNYDFKDETPYEYLAREAKIDINKAKILMFRQLYGGIYKEYKNIEYFQLIDEYVNKLWKSYNINGFIECPISGHKFTTEIKDMNPQKLFNYLLQNLETANNVLILWEIIKLLKGKKTKIVLYTYDAILIDYCEEDNILEDIKNIFFKNNLKIKVTKGKNYGEMS